MPLDSYVTLGRSGLRVSPFTLGTMTFGEDWGWGASVAESEAMLDDYLDRGGNFIDTANVYTNGHAETIVGDFFAGQPERRDRVVIGSKFFGNLYAGDPNGGGAGRKAIVQQLEQSLRRLRTDYIDVYWLHNWDRAAPVEETLGTLDDLVGAGKIRYVGFSDVPAWKTARGAGAGAVPWLGADHRRPTRVFPARADRRRRADPDGNGPRHGRHALGPPEERLLSGKFSRRNSSPVDSARTALVGTPVRTRLRRHRCARAGRGGGRAQARPRWRSRGCTSRPGVSSTLIGARRSSSFARTSPRSSSCCRPSSSPPSTRSPRRH